METYGFQQVMRSVCAAVLTFSLVLTPALYAQTSEESQQPGENNSPTESRKKTKSKRPKAPRIGHAGDLPAKHFPSRSWAIHELNRFVHDQQFSSSPDLLSDNRESAILVFSPPASPVDPLEGMPFVRPLPDNLNVYVPSEQDLLKGVILIGTGLTMGELLTLAGTRLVCLFLTSQQMLEEFLHMNRATCSNDSGDDTESCSVDVNGKSYQLTCQDSEANPDFAICSFEPVRS